MKSHDFVFVAEIAMPIVACSVAVPRKVIAVLSTSLSLSEQQ